MRGKYVVAVREGGPEEHMRYVGPFTSRRRAADIAAWFTRAIEDRTADDPDSTAWAYVVELESGSLARNLDEILDWATDR